MMPLVSRNTRPAELGDDDRSRYLIDLRDLHKKHGHTTALAGLTLQVPRGAVCALLGVNGSGKTTALKLLLGMARPDRGTGWVFGRRIDCENDSVEIRRRTGFVTETKELYQHLTVQRSIQVTRKFYPRWRDDLEQRLLQEFALPPKQRVTALSKGMRAKLALLLACCRGAELLVLDEPTDGLDPAAAEQLLQSLLGLVADEAVTVLLSSHQLHEVERVADRVAILHAGRVVLHGELDDLRRRVRRVRLVLPDERSATPEVPAHIIALHVERQGRVWSVLVAGAQDGDAERWGEELAARSAATSVEFHPVGLRELFLAVSGAPV